MTSLLIGVAAVLVVVLAGVSVYLQKGNVRHCKVCGNRVRIGVDAYPNYWMKDTYFCKDHAEWKDRHRSKLTTEK
jgi:hypothetical protein